MKWEYKVIYIAWGENPWERLIEQISTELNLLGQQGWELQRVPTGVNRDSQGAPAERV
jgi:hypothetical protein